MKRKIKIILAAVLLSIVTLIPAEAMTYSPALNKSIDSLKLLLDKNPNDYMALEGLGMAINTVDPNNSYDYFRRAVKAARVNGNMKESVYSMMLLGNALTHGLHYRQAVDVLRNGIFYAEKYGDYGNLIYGYSQLGKVYSILGRYLESKQMFEKSSQVISYNKLLDSVNKVCASKKKLLPGEFRLFVVAVTMYINYSRILEYLDQTDSAIAMIKHAIPIASKFDAMMTKHVIAYQTMYEYEFHRRHYEDALKYALEAEKVLYARAGTEFIIINKNEICIQIARCRVKLGDYTGAEKTLLDCGKHPRKTFFGQADYYLLLAEIYLKLKNNSEAYKIISKFEANTDSLDNGNLLILYKLCYHYYKDLGNYAAALRYNEKSEALSDSLAAPGQSVQEIANNLLKQQYNDEINGRRIKEIGVEIARSKLLYFKLIGAAAIFIIAISLFMLRICKKSRRENKIIFQKRKEIDEKYDYLSAAIKNAKDEIARYNSFVSGELSSIVDFLRKIYDPDKIFSDSNNLYSGKLRSEFIVLDNALKKCIDQISNK